MTDAGEGGWAQSYEAVFCIFLGVLAYLGKSNADLAYPQILYLIALLLALNLAAGLSLKLRPDRAWIPAMIVCANNATITAMLAYSGGPDSSLWVLYLLPIYTACLLLRGREVAWITAGAISFNLLYYLSRAPWGAAVAFALLLKSGVFVFSAVATYRLGQKERASRRALEERSAQLRQAQKMEAVGRLAGGVAHDFNNILTSVLGSTHFLLENTPAGDPRIADIREIQDSAARAAQLTRQLLAFSRHQAFDLRDQDLNELIRRDEAMLRRLIREDIRLDVSLGPDVAPVRIDSSQFGQVLMNLVINARDALPGGGRIELATGSCRLAAPVAASDGPVPPASYALLSVGDTGVGMDERTLSRVFEPFFTTKADGKGTGLGLSIAYGIVKQSGGYISVLSRPGEGTEFRIYLPSRAPLEPAPRRRPSHARPSRES